MAKKQKGAPITEASPAESPVSTPTPVAHGQKITVDSLFQYLEAGGAQKAQIIRVTGAGRLDAALTPQRTGNILLLIEIDPNAGGVIV